VRFVPAKGRASTVRVSATFISKTKTEPMSLRPAMKGGR
jgi:hypothetical protein